MSAAEVAAREVRTLTQEDWRVLHSLERGLPVYELVPLPYVVSASGLNAEEAEYRLGLLSRKKLVLGGHGRYALVAAGLDAIALHAFAKKNLLDGLGKPLGLGKESDVFEAIGGGGEFAVKFFRIGRTSFRAARKKRGYASPLRQHQWLQTNILAAKREFQALVKLAPHGVSVPEAVSRERHAILMKRVEGALLSQWNGLERPAEVLKSILTNLRLAYTGGGLVNADLSEFNILYDGTQVYLIDWPQCVLTSHPNSGALLDRDILNILRFFRRRYKVDCGLEPASLFVRGWKDQVLIVEA